MLFAHLSPAGLILLHFKCTPSTHIEFCKNLWISPAGLILSHVYPVWQEIKCPDIIQVYPSFTKSTCTFHTYLQKIQVFDTLPGSNAKISPTTPDKLLSPKQSGNPAGNPFGNICKKLDDPLKNSFCLIQIYVQVFETVIHIFCLLFQFIHIQIQVLNLLKK